METTNKLEDIEYRFELDAREKERFIDKKVQRMTDDERRKYESE